MLGTWWQGAEAEILRGPSLIPFTGDREDPRASPETLVFKAVVHRHNALSLIKGPGHTIPGNRKADKGGRALCPPCLEAWNPDA